MLTQGIEQFPVISTLFLLMLAKLSLSILLSLGRTERKDKVVEHFNRLNHLHEKYLPRKISEAN